MRLDADAVSSTSEARPLSSTPGLTVSYHSGKPYLRFSPPGGRRSWSAALTVSTLVSRVVYVYVVSGVTSGWNTSLRKDTIGGEVEKSILNRRIAFA